MAASEAPVPIRPADAPAVLKNATKFKTHADVFHGKWVIETLRRYEPPAREELESIAEWEERMNAKRHLLAPLEIAVARHTGSKDGRKRIHGKWHLCYLAFVFSRHPDVRPWWQTAGHSIWTAAGFSERPSYATTHARFAELEHPRIIEAFEDVAARLIHLAAIGSGGEVGKYLHVDSTDAETHARLEHICPKDSPCWAKFRLKRRPRRPQDHPTGPPEALTEVLDADGPADPVETEGPAKDPKGESGQRVTPGASILDVREERQAHAAEPEPEDQDAEDTEIGDADSIERKDDKLVVTVGGCLFQALDPTAGIRAYIVNGKVKRFWLGFYNAKAIDHYTGAPVAVQVTSASTNEFVTYPSLIESAMANTGRQPVAVVGYSVTKVFEFNTRRGIASVFPWRASGARIYREDEDCETHDRHGIVRCKHCGGPTEFVTFTRSAGSYGPGRAGVAEIKRRGPRLEVRCATPVTDGCKKRQTIACETSWRMLVPLWRDHPTYLALRHSHNSYERTHHHWRVRWRVAADDHSLRPKRRGIDCQQLRANAALVVEWLMICWREQWLPDHRPRGIPHPDRLLFDDGTKKAEAMAAFRHAEGLQTWFGPKALELGLGELTPVRVEKVAKKEDPADPDDQHIEPDLPDDDPVNEHIPQTAAEVDPDVDIFD